MTPQDDLPGAAPGPVSSPAPVAPAGTTAPNRLDSVIEQFARDYMQDRRSERRWRVIFRVMWLVLIAFVLLSALAARRAASVPTGPHTALVEVRGEIAADTEASAERIVSALKSAFEEKSA